MRAAEGLGLSTYSINTFTNWEVGGPGSTNGLLIVFGKLSEANITQPPKSINLIIVVSFGLFVPKRILRSVKYGGLNVHPSFLPEYVFTP